MIDQERRGRCPPLDPDRARVPDYKPQGREPGFDGNPPEFGMRKDYVYVDGEREATESPENNNASRIKWLCAHHRITKRQFAAGDRFEQDWNQALIEPRANSVLVGAGGGAGTMHPNDAKRAAMQRDGDARQALGRLLPIVQLVVIDNLSIGKASAMLRIHGQAAIELLKVGLETLADHYKLPVLDKDR